VDYRNWGGGEQRAHPHFSADPHVPDDPDHRIGRHRPPAEFRVPGQRSRQDDQDLARRRLPVNWSPSGGRPRQLPVGDPGEPGPISAAPDRWRRPDDRWRPTLDTTDWRYATGDVEFPYPPWAEDQRPEADATGGRFGPLPAPTERHRLGGSGWRENVDTERWGPPSDDGRAAEPWNNRSGHEQTSMSDTGAWDRMTDTGEQLGTRLDRTGGFWSGLRLAGDDPRWMATPASAPRSPAVSLPQRTPPGNPAAPPATPPLHRVPPGTPPATRMSPGRPSPAQVPPTGTTPADDGPGSTWHALLATVAWYVVTALVVLAWLLTLDGSPPPDCAEDAAQRCEPARARAAAAIVDSGPRIAAALGASMVIAVLLRLASAWRAATIGLAAGVIGAGLSTLMISVVTGQPLG
jgi:hypothetical protein